MSTMEVFRWLLLAVYLYEKLKGIDAQEVSLRLQN